MQHTLDNLSIWMQQGKILDSIAKLDRNAIVSIRAINAKFKRIEPTQP